MRTDRVDSYGKLTVRHAGRLHHIGIGHRWATTPVLMLIADLHIRIITFHYVARHLSSMSRDITLAVAEGFEPYSATR
ncbi:hypothetical protein [Mycobacterium simiae]|uniref:hypothetical protein n=1 Tax=Mycobacterium simiae TaxID=1784 RepID=UPI0015942E13|nr:hypothetical protein [Mycobacterium simiae]